MYKYQPLNVITLENLVNKCIWFSTPNKLNDPLDGENIFRIIKPDENKWQEIIQNFKQNKYTKFPSLCAIIKNFNSNEQNELKQDITINAYDNLYNSINKEKRVACFSRNNNVYLMWSHYADGHRGFCLEFNSKYPPFDRAKDVTYQETHIFIEMEEIFSGKLNLNKYLNEKTKSWKYEKEMRIIEKNEKVEYDKHALNAIYFGLNMPEAHKKIIASIIKNLELPTYIFDTKVLVNKLGFSYYRIYFDNEFNRFITDGNASKKTEFI